MSAPDERFHATQEHLPEVVRGYVARSLGTRDPVPRRVRVTQAGEMWQRPGGRALRFTAVEDFAVDRIAFAWRARFPLAGPLAMRVVDDYDDGAGRLEARLLGIPIMRQDDAATVKGQAYRYLAELPWAPYAIARNHEIRWRELDGRSAEVAAHVAGERLAVVLEFDGAGDIVRASCPARPRRLGKASVLTPWGGTFSGYDVLGGIRLPTRAEVYWDLPEGRFVYWRGVVRSVETSDEPLPRGGR